MYRPLTASTLSKSAQFGSRTIVSGASYLRLAAVLMVIGLIASSFYIGSSASPPGALSIKESHAPTGPDSGVRRASALLNRANLAPSVAPLIAPQPFAETIATFAADCTTPKASFNLGETVCAITDGVDLNYPEPGRWVDWILTGTTNTIVSGSRTTTRITTNPQTFTYTPTSTGVYKVEITQDLNGQDDPQTPAVFTVSLGPDSIATFESTCNVAQDNFTLVMGAVTVCAKADANFSGNRYIYWVDDQGRALQTDVITSTSPSATRSMTAAGNYWVYFSDSDGSLRSKHAFTVSDPGQPVVDVAVSKNLITTTDIVAGGFITFELVVINRGPDTASTVELTDAVPAHVSYVNSTQDSGPPFTRTATTPTTTWISCGARVRRSLKGSSKLVT